MLSRLIAERARLAASVSLPPYMVASEQVVLQLAEMRPSTAASLARVQGFTDAWLAKYGEAFLTVVQDFCASTDDFPEDELLFAASAAAAADDVIARSSLPSTVQDSYR